MKIVLFGRSGQVATEIQRRVPKEVDLTVIGRDTADFSDPQAVFNVAREQNADAIINAVAYTAVDLAEQEEGLANTVNGTSVGSLARACAETKTALVHISTDYVFDGSGDTPWSRTDATKPCNAYGRSKLLGEQAITDADIPSAILRTSWVFSAHGKNFVHSMLRLGAEWDELRIVADQIGGPTPAAAIADACLTLAKNLVGGGPTGIYHFAGTPEVSWAEFARDIFSQSGLTTEVVDIPSSEFPTPAQRPYNSRMDCSQLEIEHGISRPNWRDGLQAVLAELGVRNERT